MSTVKYRSNEFQEINKSYLLYCWNSVMNGYYFCYLYVNSCNIVNQTSSSVLILLNSIASVGNKKMQIEETTC